jgi:hypothetical protein
MTITSALQACTNLLALNSAHWLNLCIFNAAESDYFKLKTRLERPPFRMSLGTTILSLIYYGKTDGSKILVM